MMKMFTVKFLANLMTMNCARADKTTSNLHLDRHCNRFLDVLRIVELDRCRTLSFPFSERLSQFWSMLLATH